MYRALFIIGTIGLATAGIWWATFYLDVARSAGTFSTTDDFKKLIDLYGQCAFFDREQCLKAQRAAALAGKLGYQPYLLWFAFGMLASGAIVMMQHAWLGWPLARRSTGK